MKENFYFRPGCEDPKLMQRNALLILNLMKDQNALNYAREDFKRTCQTIMSWAQVADKMYKNFIL
jgi:hypothetical protein